jgi:hypothetical protein
MKYYLLIFSLSMASCTLEPVKPWERGKLAQDKMQLVVDSLETLIDGHIYASKESASGGGGIGGGGCGCN